MERRRAPDVASDEARLRWASCRAAVCGEAGLKGQRGFFTRDDSGAIVDVAGRLFRRIPGGS